MGAPLAFRRCPAGCPVALAVRGHPGAALWGGIVWRGLLLPPVFLQQLEETLCPLPGFVRYALAHLILLSVW